MVEKSTRKTENEKNVNDFLNNIDVLPIDEDTACTYGKMKNSIVQKYGPKKERAHISMEKLGISDNDLWIASVALKNNLTVVSRDGGFFRIKEANSDLKYETWPIIETTSSKEKTA